MEGQGGMGLCCSKRRVLPFTRKQRGRRKGYPITREPLKGKESAGVAHPFKLPPAVAGGIPSGAGLRTAECTVPNMPCCAGREQQPGGGKHSQFRPRREPASYTSEKHAGVSRPPGQEPRPSSRVRNKQIKAEL